MVVKVYVSGISASKEVKKRQQRVLLILDSVQVNYEQIDVTEPGREEERQKIQSQWKIRNESSNPLPPQIFSDETYLGDYDDFNAAVDVDDILTFLRLENKHVEKVNDKIKSAIDDKLEEVHNNVNSNEENKEEVDLESEFLDEKNHITEDETTGNEEHANYADNNQQKDADEVEEIMEKSDEESQIGHENAPEHASESEEEEDEEEN